MSDRAEDLNEWRSEQYTKNAKSYEPKIELTINEAKVLLECACCVDAYTFAKCKKLFNCLERRIEQAEAAKICNDYNKALNKVVEEFQKQAEKGNETNSES